MNSDEQRSTGTPSTPPAGYQGGTSTPSTPPAGYPGSGYGAYGQPQDTRSYPSYLGSDQGAGTAQGQGAYPPPAGSPYGSQAYVGHTYGSPAYGSSPYGTQPSGAATTQT